MARDVMLVGSVPLHPAMSVFNCAHDHGLRELLPRIPDGEQHGWARPLMMGWDTHPAVEPYGDAAPITRRPSGVPFFNEPFRALRLRPGLSAEELLMEDMGVASGFRDSYAQFTAAKTAGILAPDTRFVATLPGPGTVSGRLSVPPAELFPVIEESYRREIERILSIAPHEDLAIQIDLATEVIVEEFRRRPDIWDAPRIEQVAAFWPFDETVSLICRLAGMIPEPIQLGFHLCAFYHIDESQGQDLNVHVDWANALVRGTPRAIDYIHLPTTPSFAEKDFLPLKRLDLAPRNKLFLGVIHAEDGVEGARRRIEAARAVRPDFGIASYCGLNIISVEQSRLEIPIETIFDIHREAAQVA